MKQAWRTLVIREQSSVTFCYIAENNEKDMCCTIEVTILNGLLHDKVRVLLHDEVKALQKMSTMFFFSWKISSIGIKIKVGRGQYTK